MFSFRQKVKITTSRLTLRPPMHSDFKKWKEVRYSSKDFLTPWEPRWARDHLTRKSFANRVYWSKRAINQGTGLPLLLLDHGANQLYGAITLDNIRRGPTQSGTLGYWVGEEYARRGYMTEAINAVVQYAFTELDLSRIESACLADNKPSRGVLEKCGFKYEGVAQAYIQIDGRWRTHVLYSALRYDRRGKTSAGID